MIFEEMHTILNCDLSYFQSDLLNVASMMSIKTDEMLRYRISQKLKKLEIFRWQISENEVLCGFIKTE